MPMSIKIILTIIPLVSCLVTCGFVLMGFVVEDEVYSIGKVRNIFTLCLVYSSIILFIPLSILELLKAIF